MSLRLIQAHPTYNRKTRNRCKIWHLFRVFAKNIPNLQYVNVNFRADNLEIIWHQQFALSPVLLFSYFCTCLISFPALLFPFLFFLIFSLLSSFAFVFINHRFHVCHHCSHNFLHHECKHQPASFYITNSNISQPVFTSQIKAPASHHHCSHSIHYQSIILIN